MIMVGHKLYYPINQQLEARREMTMNYDFLDHYTFSKQNMTLRNHIVMAPTTMWSSFEDGSVTENELNYYRMRSAGPGMIITEVAHVHNMGKGFEGGLSAADDDKIPGLSQLASAIQSQGAKAVLQLFSAGRQSTTAILRGKQPISASSRPYPHGQHETPRALTHDEIVEIIDDFAQATKRAILAGFDGVELHGANLYLLQQFLSPDGNQREDIWGGTLEKRMRFPLAVVGKVSQIIARYATRPFVLGYRQSPEETITPGLTLSDSLLFTEKLIQLPIDYLHLSLKDARQTPFRDKNDQETIVQHYRKILPVNYPLMVAGLLKRPQDVEDLLDNGVTLAAMARELIVEPNWVQKVSNNDEKAIRYAISPSDFALLGIPDPLKKRLLSMFKNGLPVTTDIEFDATQPWRYYKKVPIIPPKPIDPTKLMTLKPKKTPGE